MDSYQEGGATDFQVMAGEEFRLMDSLQAINTVPQQSMNSLGNGVVDRRRSSSFASNSITFPFDKIAFHVLLVSLSLLSLFIHSTRLRISPAH